MFNADTVKNLIDLTRAEHDALDNEISNLESEISKKREKINFLSAKIAAYKDVIDAAFVAISTPEEVSTISNASVVMTPSNTLRRMRLGSKKRVIYALIANNVASYEEIKDVIERSSLDIDARYIRDIIRTSEVDGDIVINEDGRISLTEIGHELLRKSNLPLDWTRYGKSLEAALQNSARLNEIGLPEGSPEVGNVDVRASTAPLFNPQYQPSS